MRVGEWVTRWKNKFYSLFLSLTFGSRTWRRENWLLEKRATRKMDSSSSLSFFLFLFPSLSLFQLVIINFDFSFPPSCLNNNKRRKETSEERRKRRERTKEGGREKDQITSSLTSLTSFVSLSSFFILSFSSSFWPAFSKRRFFFAKIEEIEEKEKEKIEKKEEGERRRREDNLNCDQSYRFEGKENGRKLMSFPSIFLSSWLPVFIP